MRSPLRKLSVLTRTIDDWPNVLLDKLHLARRDTYTTKTGLVLKCRPRTLDINEATAVLSGTEYPIELLRLGKGSTVIDIGAHIGSFSMLVSQVNRGVTYSGFAFEPSPGSFELLCENLARNGIDHVTPVRCAVTDRDGEIVFNVGSEPIAHAVSKAGPGVQVPSVRLSTFCREHGIDQIDVLKLDIEGSEYAVFGTDYNFIAESVSTAIIEFHAKAGGGITWLRERTSDHFDIDVIHDRGATGVVSLKRRPGTPPP